MNSKHIKNTTHNSVYDSDATGEFGNSTSPPNHSYTPTADYPPYDQMTYERPDPRYEDPYYRDYYDYEYDAYDYEDEYYADEYEYDYYYDENEVYDEDEMYQDVYDDGSYYYQDYYPNEEDYYDAEDNFYYDDDDNYYQDGDYYEPYSTPYQANFNVSENSTSNYTSYNSNLASKDSGYQTYDRRHSIIIEPPTPSHISSKPDFNYNTLDQNTLQKDNFKNNVNYTNKMIQDQQSYFQQDSAGIILPENQGMPLKQNLSNQQQPLTDPTQLPPSTQMLTLHLDKQQMQKPQIPPPQLLQQPQSQQEQKQNKSSFFSQLTNSFNFIASNTPFGFSQQNMTTSISSTLPSQTIPKPTTATLPPHPSTLIQEAPKLSEQNWNTPQEYASTTLEKIPEVENDSSLRSPKLEQYSIEEQEELFYDDKQDFENQNEYGDLQVDDEADTMEPLAEKTLGISSGYIIWHQGAFEFISLLLIGFFQLSFP